MVVVGLCDIWYQDQNQAHVPMSYHPGIGNFSAMIYCELFANYEIYQVMFQESNHSRVLLDLVVAGLSKSKFIELVVAFFLIVKNHCKVVIELWSSQLLTFLFIVCCTMRTHCIILSILSWPPDQTFK